MTPPSPWLTHELLCSGSWADSFSLHFFPWRLILVTELIWLINVFPREIQSGLQILMSGLYHVQWPLYTFLLSKSSSILIPSPCPVQVVGGVADCFFSLLLLLLHSSHIFSVSDWCCFSWLTCSMSGFSSPVVSFFFWMFQIVLLAMPNACAMVLASFLN